MSFVVLVAPFFRSRFTVLFFFTSRSFLAPYRVRLLESISLVHRGSAFSSHLGCAMRKSRKVVPITKAKPKPSAAIEVPVPVEGAIRILTCHRTPGQISFSLGPLLASGEAAESAKPSKGNLLVFPRPVTDSEND